MSSSLTPEAGAIYVHQLSQAYKQFVEADAESPMDRWLSTMFCKKCPSRSQTPLRLGPQFRRYRRLVIGIQRHAHFKMHCHGARHRPQSAFEGDADGEFMHKFFP